MKRYEVFTEVTAAAAGITPGRCRFESPRGHRLSFILMSAPDETKSRCEVDSSRAFFPSLFLKELWL
jgi:hypothetical protein